MTCVWQVIEDNKQWWKLRNRSGQAGYVPFNILDVVKIEESDSVFNQVSSHTIQCISNFTFLICISHSYI